LVISIWPPASRYTFVGLMSASARALVRQPAGAFWPVMTALVAGALCAWGAIKVFERQEL
jgi:hypothetical protein